MCWRACVCDLLHPDRALPSQAETSISRELTERSQVSRLKAELAAEQSRAAEAEDAAERLAVELEVRSSSAGCTARELTLSSQSSRASISALQSELGELKQRIWESDAEAQQQCVHALCLPWVWLTRSPRAQPRENRRPGRRSAQR
jgi:hypothetical protein